MLACVRMRRANESTSDAGGLKLVLLAVLRSAGLGHLGVALAAIQELGQAVQIARALLGRQRRQTLKIPQTSYDLPLDAVLGPAG